MLKEAQNFLTPVQLDGLRMLVTPMPQVYCSHSSGPDSYTRPGSNAAAGRTCPAPSTAPSSAA